MVRIARELRREMSLPEVLLWRLLKQSDLKFRRQHPCGPFVVDFYCPAAKLVIEIEGMAHDRGDRPQRDERRFEWLEARGYGVLRIPAGEVLANVGATAESIVAACRGRGAWPLHHRLRRRSPSPSAAPTGRILPTAGYSFAATG